MACDVVRSGDWCDGCSDVSTRAALGGRGPSCGQGNPSRGGGHAFTEFTTGSAWPAAASVLRAHETGPTEGAPQRVARAMRFRRPLSFPAVRTPPRRRSNGWERGWSGDVSRVL